MNRDNIKAFRAGKIGVIPTDTLYGLVSSALNSSSVERVYATRRRNLKKPCIILIPDTESLALFDITLNAKTRQCLNSVWPGPVSVILPCNSDRFEYLHRGTKTLAFRQPNDEKLIALLKGTGPLIAPSANVEGRTPATTIEEARAYFGDSIDLYVDGGTRTGQPSRIAYIEKGELVYVR